MLAGDDYVARVEFVHERVHRLQPKSCIVSITSGGQSSGLRSRTGQ